MKSRKPVDPEKEQEMTKLADKIVKYRFTDNVLEELKMQKIPEKLVAKLDDYRKNSFNSDEDLKKTLEDIWGEKNMEEYWNIVTELAIIPGEYFNDVNDQGVLIGERLAKFLKLNAMYLS